MNCDIFEEVRMDEYYKDIGPKRFTFSVRWPFTMRGAKIEELKETMYTHGLWPTPRLILTYEQLKNDHDKLFDEPNFNKMFDKYKEEVLEVWPDLKNPTCLMAAKRLIIKGWNWHGKPAGIKSTMYLYYGLALRNAIPDNFGIPVGVPMTLKDASKYAKNVMMELKIFGKEIGAPVYPEIYTSIRQSGAPFIINEIRPHFTRVLVNGKAEFRAIGVEDNKYYTGAANHEKSIVILPTRQQHLSSDFSSAQPTRFNSSQPSWFSSPQGRL
ncbi:uncharacterized protein LOC130985315 [Salvia miltiorrhiza]|nr:uncharacterized protein LOC130985315 [Salvia miltiorrhiza]